ncbi:MAG: aminotransferase class III-fold pyridoxal phosphate-dependent enzyme [Halocynthiibacter sp.]
MYDIWETCLAEHWGISAALSALDGEYDLNFLATAPTASYIVKVMRTGCDADFIDMQCAALAHLSKTQPNVVPKVIPTKNGALFATIKDAHGAPRIVWVLEKMQGTTYANFTPKSPALIHDLGRQVGILNRHFIGFTHPALERDFKWNLMTALWVKNDISCLTSQPRRALITTISQDFEAILPKLRGMPHQALHNDVNDYNILASGDLKGAQWVSGLIDLGDMCAGPRIIDLAICAAYIVLDHPNPEHALADLVSGYHAENPLSAEEIDLIWPLLRMRLAVSVVNSTRMATDQPEDPYVTISQAPAWRFLEKTDIHAGLVAARLRTACELPVVDAAPRVLNFLNDMRGACAPIMGVDLTKAPMGSLSVENATVPQNPFDLPQAEAAKIGRDLQEAHAVWLGYYNEPRLIYTEPAFQKGPWKASNRRTVHLAVDGFAKAGTKMHAPLPATVHAVENRGKHLDYGGVVILRHETPDGDAFYTLYGHLNPSCVTELTIGQAIAQGEAFAELGDVSENGGWAPHVHFQLALTTDGMGDDWPGVGDPDEMYLWGAMCPNPAALLNLPDENTCYAPVQKSEILEKRRAHFGANVKLSYADPVMFVRGWKHHLFDEWGRPHLDAYNNVPHVGHAHPRIAAVAEDQLKRMNSNTRYLHPAQTAFADKILARMPAALDTVFFVNSGTEANELALRLTRAHTGGKDMIMPNHGYHGNTTGVIDISAYKFNAKGGVGQPDWVQIVDAPDDYNGPFRRGDSNVAESYAAQVGRAVEAIKTRGGQLAGFIAETFPSVGGQIIPPQGYLKDVYAQIRAAGGLCIADEVQTGLGRLGDYYFAFEQQNVEPDIVVLGKPIGNGHPLGVLITRRDIAESFAQGPEFFSTFGGSTLSCRIGKEVLDIVDDEGLQENAAQRGKQLKSGLMRLMDTYDVIGDVRGIGLFIGVELVTSRTSRKPATAIADYVLNRMRENRILMGTEGPHHNILKIRPPLTIDENGIDMILSVMDEVLSETAVTEGLDQS